MRPSVFNRVTLKSGEIIPPPEQIQKPKTSNTLGVSAAVAAIILVVAGGVAFWFQPWLPEKDSVSVQHMAFPLPDKPSIAVLPFANMSDDADQEYFVDGMTEDLITDLSKISGLFVISRNSSFAYKGESMNVRRVAEELGVRYVMEGSVRRVGNKVRINAQLIDATTDGHLWAERYDGTLRGHLLAAGPGDCQDRCCTQDRADRYGAGAARSYTNAQPRSLRLLSTS